MRENMSKELGTLGTISFGSVIYGFATSYFIFPHNIILGGTSGIAVILNRFLSFSAGTYSVVLNSLLLILGVIFLGKGMAGRTLFGSTMTTIAIGIFDMFSNASNPWIENSVLSTIIGSALIAVASALMFYVKSSSGGTDIVALIVQKYSSLNIGRCLFLTDVLIVIFGCICFEPKVIVASVLGFLIKVFGIDFMISKINKMLIRRILKERK